MAHSCVICGNPIPSGNIFLGTAPRSPYGDGFICVSCKPNIDQWMAANRSERAEKQTEVAREYQELLRQADKVIVTTTHHVEGCYVAQYLGIESVEYVMGTGFVSELVSDISDLFGARSKPFEGKLQKAKQEAMLSLKLVAHQKGANAVIGVDLDYAEFSGNRVALILNGTLVVVKPRPPKV